MVNGLGIACLLCIALGCLITSIAYGVPYWQQNDPDDTINENIMQHSGLWIQCVSMSTGNWQCDDFDKFFLALPVMQQAARGLGMASIMMGIVACGLIGLSISENMCGASFSQTKRNRLIAGGLAILAGLCIIAGASWYANDIHKEYMIAEARRLTGRTSITRIVFGSSLFLAWGGGALQMLGGILALCMGCEIRDEVERRPYTYRGAEMKSMNRPTDEYV